MGRYIWDNKEAERITANVNDICDVQDYWQNVGSKIIENNLFDGHFIKFNNHIFWMPIDDIPLNLARIEMMIFAGYIKVKLFIAWNGDLYKFLENKLDHIEKELGFKVKGENLSNPYQIVIYNLTDINNKDLWEDAMHWHISVAKRF